MPTVRPEAKRRNKRDEWVYDARIPAEVTLEQAATAMALFGGRHDRARIAADALPTALRELVALLLSGDNATPPRALVDLWRERLVADGIYPEP